MTKFKKEFKKFDKLTFDDFTKMASSDELSDYEKIGFPDQYRDDFDQAIFQDIIQKLEAINIEKSKILDIGSGCSPLVNLFYKNAKEKKQKYVINDSKEMLKKYNTDETMIKLEGRFPECLGSESNVEEMRFDAILVYSVLQYVSHINLYQFIDSAVSLLAPGGKILLGDIPNLSMKNRFLKSDSGKDFHKKYTGKNDAPKINNDYISTFEIDDGIIIGILTRYRISGLNTFIVPQSKNLPMANRREDIIIERI